MSINAVSSSTTIATQAVRQQPDQAEVRNPDDIRKSEVKPQNTQKAKEPKPTVIAVGQTIGTQINTTA